MKVIPFPATRNVFSLEMNSKMDKQLIWSFNRSKIAIFQIKMTYRLIENVASIRSLVECNALSLNPKVYKKVI